MDNILFSMGMQSTGSQDPWQKSCGAVSIHLSVAGLKMIMVNVPWSKRLRDWSSQPDWTIRISFSLSLFLSHIVVLVGVLLVTLHIVPVNKRLYPLLQVSRLKGQNTDRRQRLTHGALASISGYFYTCEVWGNHSEKLIHVSQATSPQQPYDTKALLAQVSLDLLLVDLS